MYIYVARLKRSAMGGILQVAVISLLVLVCHGNPKEIRSRQISAVDNYDDEVYKILIKLCKGTFHVPVAKRTATQKSTIIRYWRNRESYSVEKADGSLKLLFNGKPVVKKSELKSLVTSEFKHCKGIGSRKLKHRLNQRFSGFSEPCVNKILSKSKLNQMSNARFNNKVIIRPIRASAVQIRHQIDLIDLRTNAVSLQGKVYNYVLTIQDVFSRYIWLRPLERKKSFHVAHKTKHTQKK
ncbi:uncharacterized protein LOC114574639 [Exaiptasia diaphana]|uniref:Uncharacterized protein n=1 Tax=Exaiptasia diaphana TaxID=2652724 RepID=A0A913YE51_EXADI|nr:uncharacterized protein LOC114574639 [Exaiptasia diaphana]